MELTPEQLQAIQNTHKAVTGGTATMTPPPAVTPVTNVPEVQTEPLIEEGAEDRTLLNRSLRSAGRDVVSAPGLVALPRLGIAGAKYMLGFTEEFGDDLIKPEYQPLVEQARGGNQMAAIALANLGDEALRGSIGFAKDLYDYGTKTFDIIDNEDGSAKLDETLGGIALTAGAAFPTGGTSVLARMLGSGSNLATKLSQKALIRYTARAAEMMTPVTIGASKANIGANFAVGAALEEGMRHATGEMTIVDTVLGNEGDLPADEEGLGLDDAAAIGGMGIGMGALSLALGRGGSKAVRATEKVTSQFVSDVPTGPIPMESAADVISVAVNKVSDADEVISQGVEKVAGKTVAAHIDDVVASHTGSTVDAAIDRAYKLGTADMEGEIRFHKPINAVRDDFRKMDKQTQRTADFTYRVQNELSRRGMGKRATMPETDEELVRMARLGRSNPAVRQYMNDMNEIMKTFTDWREKEGIISAAQAKLERQLGYYMPHVEKQGTDHIIERAGRTAKRWLTTEDPNLNKIDVAAREKRNVGQMSEKMRMSEVFDDYVQSQMREINAHRARRDIIDAITNRKVQGKEHVLVQRLGDKEPSRGQTVTVRRDGVDARYEVGDKRLHKALQFRPRTAIPLANSMRRFQQKLTTGNWNPLFAPMSAVYEMGIAGIGTRTNLVTGPMDAAMRRWGVPDRVRTVLAGPARVVDIPYTYMTGFLDGIYGRRLQMEAQRLADIAAASGLDVDAEAATKAADTFLQSMYGTMHVKSRVGGTFVDDMANLDAGRAKMDAGLKNALGRIGESRTAQWYHHALDSIRDGMHMGLLARNYTEEMARIQKQSKGVLTGLSKERETRLVNDVRKVFADPTKQSGSEIINIAASASPYANTILQSTVHLAHHMLTNPAAMSTVAFAGSVKWLMTQQMSDEQREHYEYTMPSWERVMHMPLVWGEGVDDMILVPLGHELGTMTSVTSDLIDAGLSSDRMIQSLTTPERIKAAFGDLIGFVAPPALSVPYAMAFGEQMDLGALMRQEALSSEPTESGGVSVARGIGAEGGLIGDTITNIMYSAAGTTGRALVNTAEAVFDHPQGPMSREAWAHGLDVFYHDYVARQSSGSLFTSAVTAEARTTPLSNKAYEVDSALKHADKVFKTLEPDYDQPLDADIPTSGLQQLPHMIDTSTPEGKLLAYEAHMVNEYFYSPDHAHIMREIGQLHRAYRETKNNKNFPVSQVNTVLNELNHHTNSRYKEILTNYDTFEQFVQSQTQNPDWNIKDFVRRAQKHIMSQ